MTCTKCDMPMLGHTYSGLHNCLRKLGDDYIRLRMGSRKFITKGRLTCVDLQYLKKQTKKGWGTHPDCVSWMLGMLEEANTLLQDNRLIFSRLEWKDKYEVAKGDVVRYNTVLD